MYIYYLRMYFFAAIYIKGIPGKTPGSHMRVGRPSVSIITLPPFGNGGSVSASANRMF